MSLLTFVLFYALVFVQAVPLVKRIVVSPKITSPTASTTWNVGDKVTVTWDTSSIPKPGDFPGQLLLGFLTSDSENLDIDHPLAQDFLLNTGSVQITVPNVPEGTSYIVVLLGDSGNASPPFKITGGSSTTTTPGTSSTFVHPSPPLTTPSSPTPSSVTPSSPPSSSSSSSPPVSPTSTSSPAIPTTTSPSSSVSSPSSSTSSSTPTPSNPASTPSTGTSSGALPARGAGARFLCAAAAAMSIVLVL